MTKIFHIVGERGCGKSLHAQMLSTHFLAQGQVCAGVDDPDSEFIRDRDEALRHWPQADVIFLEHLPGEKFKVADHDVVIRLQRVERSALV